MDAGTPLAEVPHAEEVLRRLELNINRRLDGLLHGEHQGLVPGHGSEQGETRPYMPGDDVRRMDWNVTARLREPHVRDQIADRELEAWLCVDVSPSLDFGTAKWEKRDVALAAAAGVGFLSARTGNRVGAVLGVGDSYDVIPARQGRRHLMSILSRIQAAERHSGSAASLGGLLTHAAKVSRRRGFVCVVSDFLDPVDTWQQPLALLVQRHQVLAIEVVDPRELELADEGIVEMIDPETGTMIEVQTSSKKLRERYAAAAAEQRQNIQMAISRSGAEHLKLRTDDDWLVQIVKHIATRRHIRAHAGGVRR